ncbi:hypothetical protein PR048_006430 [Dryococelus australis]|uniref:Reverse transcriptase zinc-binding domain-containing protein n=1 Tax=Dryococelus australis TaxID=614101 RepID=A0ABQ9IC62_9NEOP|nr:hypothetical protein PR048_006430 [Dryococelus australis]
MEVVVVYNCNLAGHVEDLQIYTDGSKSVDVMACAYFAPSRKATGVFKLMPTASILYAEAYAILHAIHYASASNYGRWLLSLAHHSVRKLWKQQWLVAKGDSPYGRIQPHLQQVPWFWTHRGCCRFFTTLSRLELNHGNFKAHLHRISPCEDTRCDCGVNIEDMNHILFQCPLMKDRNNFLAFLRQSCFSHHHLSTLLSTSDMEI